MNAPKHTPGPWHWHTDHRGNLSIRTPDRGKLIVMDFVRKGMQGASPRLAFWPGLAGGVERERLGGVMDDFHAAHPDALLITAAPELLAVLKSHPSPQHPPDDRGPCLCSQCDFARRALAIIETAEGKTQHPSI